MPLDSTLVDQFGNPFRGALDAVGGDVYSESGRSYTQTLSALNAEVVMDLNGHATAGFFLRSATGNLTAVFEGSSDGTNYDTTLVPYDPVLETYAPTSTVLTTVIARQFIVVVTDLKRVRCRISAYTSGTLIVAARASFANFLSIFRQIPSNLHVTATAAVNTGSTCSLPAPGIGLVHYITRISLAKLYSVVGVASAAGVVITSTNLPGSPAWLTEQAVGAAGTAPKVIDEWYQGNPLKSLAVNVATTFVAPAQLQTIWRWNVSYYVGA